MKLLLTQFARLILPMLFMRNAAGQTPLEIAESKRRAWHVKDQFAIPFVEDDRISAAMAILSLPPYLQAAEQRAVVFENAVLLVVNSQPWCPPTLGAIISSFFRHSPTDPLLSQQASPSSLKGASSSPQLVGANQASEKAGGQLIRSHLGETLVATPSFMSSLSYDGPIGPLGPVSTIHSAILQSNSNPILVGRRNPYH